MKKEFTIPKTFFHESNYAMNVRSELENDADGLIFDRYFHDIGLALHIDVMFEKENGDGDQWYLGGNEHVQMTIKDQGDSYLLTLTALDYRGQSLLQSFHIDPFNS